MRTGPVFKMAVSRMTGWAGLLAGHLLLAACGGGGGDGGTTQPAPTTCGGLLGTPFTLAGQVRYQRLQLGPGGIGPSTEWRAARFVDVEVLDSTGTTCFGRTFTDASGGYALTVAPPDGAALQIAVHARTFEDPNRDITVHDAGIPTSNSHDPNTAWRFATTTTAAPGTVIADVDVPYNGHPERPGAGFGLLDTMITCLDQVAIALGHGVGDVHAYVSLGNNFALSGTSFYRASVNVLAILGGANGNLDNSDSDYFDDAVVAHELGHYIESRWSHSMNRGGPHGGQVLEPAFAFSEGIATGLGTLLLRNALYVDSRGTGGDLLFSFSAENVTGAADPAGIGGEMTTAEIVWDLGDGAVGIPDSDGDGITVPLSELYQAFASFNPATDAPYIGAYLDRVVAQPSATAAQITALMTSPENQGISYPLSGGDIWPRAITVGGNATGTLDSLPGAGKSQCQGITSSDWFRLVIGSTTTVNLTLNITPIGGSGDDLELFLHRNENTFTPIAGSSNPGSASESITETLAPGTYIIRVVADCLGAGNRASYSLSVN